MVCADPPTINQTRLNCKLAFDSTVGTRRYCRRMGDLERAKLAEQAERYDDMAAVNNRCTFIYNDRPRDTIIHSYDSILLHVHNETQGWS